MALSDGLVGYWSPWLGSSGYRLLDRVRSNHGTLTNMDAGTDWLGSTIRGRSGRVLDFDGVNDYVDAGSSQALRPASFTYSTWINPVASANAYSQVMGFDAGLSNTQVCTLLVKSNLKLAFYVARPGGGSGYDFYDGTGATLTAGTWYHIAAQHSPAGLRVFLNSVLDGSATYTAAPNVASGAFWIGGQNGYSNRFFSGLIAESVLYNRATTIAEVQELYRIGPGWYRPYAKKAYGYAQAGFKAYWAKRQSQLIGGGVR